MKEFLYRFGLGIGVASVSRVSTAAQAEHAWPFPTKAMRAHALAARLDDPDRKPERGATA